MKSGSLFETSANLAEGLFEEMIVRVAHLPNRWWIRWMNYRTAFFNKCFEGEKNKKYNTGYEICSQRFRSRRRSEF